MDIKSMVKKVLSLASMTILFFSLSANAIAHRNLQNPAEPALPQPIVDLNDLIGEYEADGNLFACIICNQEEIEEVDRVAVLTATEEVIVIDLYNEDVRVDQIVALAQGEGLYSEPLNENGALIQVKVFNFEGKNKVQLLPPAQEEVEIAQTYTKIQ